VPFLDTNHNHSLVYRQLDHIPGANGIIFLGFPDAHKTGKPLHYQGRHCNVVFNAQTGVFASGAELVPRLIFDSHSHSRTPFTRIATPQVWGGDWAVNVYFLGVGNMIALLSLVVNRVIGGF
jgi:hypothetical protein